MKNNKIQIASDEQGNLSFLQITDSHLFADSQDDLLGVKTRKSLEAVINHLLEKNPIFQWVLSTGDISQDQSEESYRAFCTQIKRLKVPCYSLVGNHDEEKIMTQILLSEGFFQPNILESDYWSIILLNSQVSGLPHGSLDSEQFSFLEKILQEKEQLKNGKKVMICMHHHVLPVESKWIDQHILKNASEVLELISRYNCVKVVLTGHVHQSSDQLFKGIRFLSTPSTCVQFKPKIDEFTIGTLTQGYRLVTLKKSGTIETYVDRIETKEFVADPDSNGY
jgi:Icc protein